MARSTSRAKVKRRNPLIKSFLFFPYFENKMTSNTLGSILSGGLICGFLVAVAEFTVVFLLGKINDIKDAGLGATGIAMIAFPVAFVVGGTIGIVRPKPHRAALSTFIFSVIFLVMSYFKTGQPDIDNFDRFVWFDIQILIISCLLLTIISWLTASIMSPAGTRG